jgi:predicted RNA-binding Zn-ribbon protein involved in translation (DUF1610 family)
MTDHTKPLIKFVCPKCGGEDVGYDATAAWNVVGQCLELGSHFDASWCNECGDVDLRKVALTTEEAAEVAAASTEPRSHIALRELLEAARRHDAGLNDESQDCGPQPPTGDDYNSLLALIEHAAQAAGLAL